MYSIMEWSMIFEERKRRGRRGKKEGRKRKERRKKAREKTRGQKSSKGN